MAGMRRMARGYRLRLISTLLGAFIGYGLAHPYTMLIYVWGHEHGAGAGHGPLSLGMLYKMAAATFQPVMLPMALSFMLLGALIGLLVGALIDKRRRLYDAELETEKRRVALETLHELMITLSHYLLNANTVIGGMARRCRKIESNADVTGSLGVIEEEARKIDSVIRALQRITAVKTTEYVARGYAHRYQERYR